MSQFKLTIKRGQRAPDVVVAAGSAISGSDAISVNIDATAMTKGDALMMLAEIERQILEHGFPQL